MELSCSACGAEAREGGRFCHVCGAALFLTCPSCGDEQPAAAAFCSSCGSALNEGVGEDSGRPQEERRVITVLFADLVGSTTIGERLDPEDLRTLQADLFALLNAEVERFGGVSEKFAGDSVMAVFGIPQVHEDDAERAVRAALAVQAAFPAFATEARGRYGVDPALRVGVNTGEVVAGPNAAAGGELMVSGDTVNVAARLQQLAEPGAVFVGERTRRATRRVVAYRDAGALDAKGKELPLRAWQALEAVAEQRARGDGPHTAPLIGRDDDMALLRLTAARVQRERAPQLVTIFGHAGIGKSRLVEEFCQVLEVGRVVTGRCVPYGDGVTYLPLAQVASELAGVLDDDRANVALEKLRASIERTVPDDHVSQVFEVVAWTVGLSLPGHTAGIGTAGDAQRRLHDAWAQYLAALGRQELLVLVIDDIHWASAPLLDALEHFVDALEDTAVLILCPSRPEIVDTRPTWGTGRLSSSSLNLAPLGNADAADLLEALLDEQTVSQQVARAILDPADGNPFFVEEMLSMLVEQGAVERSNGGWKATPELETLRVPDSIHGVIASRIDLLEPSEREALRRCSVMGRSFWPSAVGVDDELIAGLGRRAIVSEQPRSSFSGRREFAYKHALTHEVAYTTLPRPERRELHRRVAEWLADAVPDRQAETIELIAYHYEQALLHGGPDPDLHRRAFEALLEAGDAAQRRGAYTSAKALLARALELVPSDDERARALLMAARVDVHTTSYDQALDRLDEAIAAAEAAGDQALAADALGVKARGAWLRGRWQDALDSAVAAVAVLEGLPESPELARALARLSQIEMLRSLPSAATTAARAIEVARRTGEPAAEANARINLLTVQARTGDVAQPAEWSAVIDQALAAGAHDESVRAMVNYLWTAAPIWGLDEAERFVDNATGRLAAGLAAEAYEKYVQLSLASLIYVPAGRWAEADAVIARGEAETATNRLVWLWLLTGLALRRGDLELADGYLPEFVESAFASTEPQRILPMVAVALPRAVVAQDANRVVELADAVAEMTTTVDMWVFSPLPVIRSLAAIGDHGRLEPIVRSSARPPGENVPETINKIGRGLLARLEGDAALAARLLGEGEYELTAWGRHFDSACMALEVASALEQLGDTTSAHDARARAQALLGPLGCINPY